MKAESLLQHYERIADAPDAIARLRRFILDLAVRGKLVPQDASDEPAKGFKKPKDQAAPFRLPNNWKWIEIGDQLDLLNGMAFKPTDWAKEGLRIVRIQNLNNPDAPFNFCHPEMARERSLIDNGSFLISWSGTPGTSFGAFIWDRGQAVLNQHIFRCDFRTKAFVAAFLRLAINGRLDEMIAKAHGGAGLQHITKGKLEALLIPLPPLAEQRRIVAKVDELMALCDQLEAAREVREATRDRLAAASLARLNAPDPETFQADTCFALEALPALTTRPDQIKALRQTILNLAVRGKLVPQDAKDEPASELLKRITKEKARHVKAAAIPDKKESARDLIKLTEELPASWSPIALGQVCNLVTSGSRGWAEFYSTSGRGFIRAQNIRFGKLRLDDLAFVNPPSNSEGSRTQVAKGDLLIVITGAGVTNPALLDHDPGEAYVSQHVGLVRPSDNRLSKWLLLCLMADAGGRAELVERAYGAGKPGLNLENIRSLSIPLPPLAEQHRIVAKVDALMALCDRLEASLTATAATRRRLLDALLAEALAQDQKRKAA
ncbi:restriction endonuclease subunit S [Xanthobacter versatilis]|uniref:restriction endonuclease subunit S n=1 Tax=Xanthobacter autotrophicus (strain ATCC BAA-1158 / Py2) TaxID=78245 RepID=UPI00372A8F60